MDIRHEAFAGTGKLLGPYSQAVRAGDFIYVAGQAGLDPATGNAAGPDFESQARQAFKNLSDVLAMAGSSMSRVVKTTVFLADPDAFGKLNEFFAEFFPTRPPVRSTPIVRLPRGLLISIECIALA
jgi:2-iminobutanoate/2-iminopropanoate deaminase